MSRVDPRYQQEQRDRILQAAAPLIAATGYHGMSMRGLAKSSGISLANLYNYFSSKDEILFALQKQAFENLIAATTAALDTVDDAGERLYSFIFHHVRYFGEHPDVMRVLVHQASALPTPERRAVRKLKERYFEIGRSLVGDLIRSGGDAADDTAELERLTYSLFGMLNWIHGWYRPEVHGSPRELARTIHGIALGGLAAGGRHHQIEERIEARLAALRTPPLLGRLPLEETRP